MRFPNLLHLYRVRLRARIVADLLAVVGIAVGVALVFAALVASTSLTGSVRQLTGGLVGDASLQLAARGPEGFEQGLFGRVERVKGVGSAAPVVEARANLVGSGEVRSILLVGGDPRFARFGGPLLQHLGDGGRKTKPGLVLPAPLAAELDLRPGERVRLETGAGVARVRVVGLLREADVGSLVSSPIALAPLPLVQAVAAMDGSLSRIFVSAVPGREPEVRRGLERIGGGRLQVLPADQEVAVFERAAYPANQSTALFSLLSAMVGFLFALSAMLLTVPQRRRTIAELRLAGYAPLVVVEVLLFDALVLGLAGSALGLVLGEQLSRHLFDAVPGYLAAAFPVGSQRIVTWESVAIAGAGGILAALVAVLAPLRDALSANPAPPNALVTGSGRERWWSGAGVALLALTAAIVLLAPSAALLAVGTLTAALVLLLPGLFRLSASAIESVGRRVGSPAAILAVLELRSGAARMRTIALAATGAIAVFATVSIGGANDDLQRGLDEVSWEVDRSADVWVTFRGSTSVFGATPFRLAPSALSRIERLPGVSSVHRQRGSFLDVGDYRTWVLARPRNQAHLLLDGQVREGTASLAERRVRAGGWLVLSRRIAAQQGVGVGDTIALPSPSPRPFRIAALSTNNGWSGGAIVMSSADYARAWSHGAVSAIGIELSDGAGARDMRDAVERILAGAPVSVETAAGRLRRQEEFARAGLSRLRQISAMVLIAAVLAMVAATGGAIWQRRPSLAALKVHGFGELELWRALLLECGLLLGTGCLIGAAFGLAGQIVFDGGLSGITDFPVSHQTAFLLAAQIVVLVTGTAVAVLAVPGWLAVQSRPVVGLQD